MAKKKAGKPKRAHKGAAEAAADDWKHDRDVLDILRQLEDAVYLGVVHVTGSIDPPLVFDDDAETGLRQAFGPSVHKRLRVGHGNWDKEKGEAKKDGEGPLSAAFRLGQIAAILSTTGVVSLDVARVAAEAIRKDEHCQHSGGSGDWC